jgi:hypothetical protein
VKTEAEICTCPGQANKEQHQDAVGENKAQKPRADGEGSEQGHGTNEDNPANGWREHMCPNRRDSDNYTADQDGYSPQDCGDERYWRWSELGSRWKRDGYGYHDIVENLQAREEKPDKKNRDGHKDHTDQPYPPYLLSLGSIEHWQANEQEQSTQQTDYIRRE